MSVIGLCCKQFEGNAGGVKSHFPVQLRQPLQRGRLHAVSLFYPCADYFLRKSPEVDTIARKVHFHPLLGTAIHGGG